MTERSLIYAANWKMNHGPAEARAFAERFLSLTAPIKGRSLWFFPPAVSLHALSALTRSRPDIRIGIQNAHWESKGAFTGEIAIPMAMEAGAHAVLAGHSERRQLFGETDEQVARKAKAALNLGVTPLVCVGETLAERDGARTEHVIVRQLASIIEALDPAQWPRVVLAYEPVWAIGTGKNATPDDAAQIHELIRMELGRHGITNHVPILYGGSVNAGNVLSLLARPQLDGVLVGGASLDPEGWAELVGMS
ncbi:MAG: triose-phosphate isomerase [Gemmatimonadales bacterium]